MSKQLFKRGETIKVGKNELVCTSFGYQETDGVLHDFTYNFRLKSELESEREAAEKADTKARKGEK